MKRGFVATVVLGLLNVCRAYAPGANPPMLTHASMDVGNIISIVIPESPDENINVDQLTGEFRQQLERIKKQSRASKVEHGLVTLKRVLPEMSREEKRKTLPLIRRVLHGRRVPSPGTMRNWTRDPRVEQMRESGQFVHSRSAGNPDDRRIHRDYEESGIREAAATRVEQTASDKEEYRRTNPERAYSNRRDDFARRDGESLREDRIPFVDEDSQSSKMTRTTFGQDSNANWEDQYRGEGRVYPETSTVDCNYKLDRTVRQKDPINEIVQNDRYERPSRLPELAANAPEEGADCAKQNPHAADRYPFVSRSDSSENSKRNVKDIRGYETANLPTYVNYPRDFDVNAALNPNCDDVKLSNSSVQSLRDLERNRADLSPEKFAQRREQLNSEPEGYRSLQRVLQDPREHSERSNNASGFENIVNEASEDYAEKKKRGPNYPEQLRGPSAIQPPVDRWNGPIYEDRAASNSSDEPRDSPNVYEIFGEKSAPNPGLSYMQTEQGGFRRNSNNVPKTPGPQMLPNYGADGLALRIQRAATDLHYKFDTSKFSFNATERSIEDLERIAEKSIFVRLKRLFKAPQSSKAAYNRVIVVYGNESAGKEDSSRETFTEDGRSQSTLSPSVAEPSSSTSQDLPGSTTDYVNKPRVLLTI